MNTLEEPDTKINYRQYKDGDEHAILSLYNSVFNRNTTIDQWNWAYKENPEKHLDIILAFHGPDLVGQSAGSPLRFCFKNNIIKAIRVQNAMVHPDFRKKGIFTTTLKKLTEQEKLDLGVAFPVNTISFQTFLRKLDYHYLSDVFTFCLPVASLIPAYSSYLHVVIDDKIHFPQSDRDFILSCLTHYEIFNTRSLDYLHWRFNGKSGKKYLILRAFRSECQIALIIFKLYPDTQSVDLVEFFMVEDTTNPIPCLLNSILSYFSKKDVMVKSFNIWLFPHYTCYNALYESGFRQSSFLTHIMTKSYSPGTDKSFETGTSYYFSMGDSDVY